MTPGEFYALLCVTVLQAVAVWFRAFVAWRESRRMPGCGCERDRRRSW